MTPDLPLVAHALGSGHCSATIKVAAIQIDALYKYVAQVHQHVLGRAVEHLGHLPLGHLRASEVYPDPVYRLHLGFTALL